MSVENELRAKCAELEYQNKTLSDRCISLHFTAIQQVEETEKLRSELNELRASLPKSEKD